MTTCLAPHPVLREGAPTTLWNPWNRFFFSPNPSHVLVTGIAGQRSLHRCLCMLFWVFEVLCRAPVPRTSQRSDAVVALLRVGDQGDSSRIAGSGQVEWPQKGQVFLHRRRLDEHICR